MPALSSSYANVGILHGGTFDTGLEGNCDAQTGLVLHTTWAVMLKCHRLTYGYEKKKICDEPTTLTLQQWKKMLFDIEVLSATERYLNSLPWKNAAIRGFGCGFFGVFFRFCLFVCFFPLPSFVEKVNFFSEFGSFWPLTPICTWSSSG